MEYGMWLAVGIAAVLGGAALFLAVRDRMLQNCLRQAWLDLKEILENPEENRILLSACPSAEAERLFIQINCYIQHCQQERIIWQRQERQLQEQIENISHDLRTPLTSILGYLELVDGSALTAEDQEALAVVEKKSRYLQKLIGDFYDLVRLERAGQAGTGGAFSLKLEPVEITRLIRETVLSCYLEFEKRKLKVELELPETAVMIMGDRGALERILHNLIQNALRYARSHFRICVYDAECADGRENGSGGHRQGAESGQGGGEGQGTRTCQEDRERWEARARQECREVQGTRIGQEGRKSREPRAGCAAGKPQICLDFGNDTEHLTQADIPFLFGRFYTADHARPSGSTGLGLAISRLLAEAMGGSVTAQLTEQGELHLMFNFQGGGIG